MKPMGYEAAEADWNEAFAGRPMTIDDWNRLTVGEQLRYAGKGIPCYAESRGDRIVLHIPPGLTEEDKLKLRGYMERKLRGQGGGDSPSQELRINSRKIGYLIWKTSNKEI